MTLHNMGNQKIACYFEIRIGAPVEFEPATFSVMKNALSNWATARLYLVLSNVLVYFVAWLSGCLPMGLGRTVPANRTKSK